MEFKCKKSRSDKTNSYFRQFKGSLNLKNNFEQCKKILSFTSKYKLWIFKWLICMASTKR
jgi:hypothetical protein